MFRNCAHIIFTGRLHERRMPPKRKQAECPLFATFFARVFFAVLLLAMASCRRQDAPDYDFHHAEKLAEAMQSFCQAPSESEAATNALEILGQETSGDESAEHVLLEQLQARRNAHEVMLKAQELLENGEYDALLAHIGQVEAQGIATPALLRLRDLPPALEALAVFKARMPWQDAESMRLALLMLQPHIERLADSPAFRDFLNAQQQEFLQRQKQETAEAVQALMEALTWQTIANLTDKNADSLKKLKKISPENDLFLYISANDGAPTQAMRQIISGGNGAAIASPRTFSLAFMMATPALTDDERTAGEAIIADFPEEIDDLPGTIVKARFLKSRPLAWTAFLNWRKSSPYATGMMPPFATELLHAEEARLGGSPSGLPSLTELAEAIDCFISP